MARKPQTLVSRLVARREGGEAFEDVDGVGQLIVLFAQGSGVLGLLTVGFDLLDLVLGEAVIAQSAAQIALGATTAVCLGLVLFLLGFGAARRLLDELHIESTLEFVYKFTYQANFNDIGAEHELCHVYLGKVTDDIEPNEHEIDAIRYVDATALPKEFESQPDAFTPWFKMEWQTLVNEHREILARYCDV